MITNEDKAIIDFKMDLLKDLEKKIKMGYKNQFRNIVIKIISKPKRFKKIKAPINITEDINKMDSLSRSIYSYLIDMFDVFGDSAVLNAKRIFEESGMKWGKKFSRNLMAQANTKDVKRLIKELYIEIKDLDYITISNRQLSWVFKKPDSEMSHNQNLDRYFSALYEVKALWLQSFIKGLNEEYIMVFETAEELPEQITTNITIKEGA